MRSPVPSESAPPAGVRHDLSLVLQHPHCRVLRVPRGGTCHVHFLAGRKAMTPEEKRKERHRRYNRSLKGQARSKKYEDRHPERRERWSPIMELKARDKR